MQTIAAIVLWIGYIMALVASIWLLVTAFKQSILWGLGCLFIAPVTIAFLIVHWQVAKRPFFLWLKGLALVLIAVFLLHAHTPFIRIH